MSITAPRGLRTTHAPSLEGESPTLRQNAPRLSHGPDDGYSADGRVDDIWVYIYDADGNLLTVTCDYNADGSGDDITSYTYNADGNLLTKELDLKDSDAYPNGPADKLYIYAYADGAARP